MARRAMVQCRPGIAKNNDAPFTAQADRRGLAIPGSSSRPARSSTPDATLERVLALPCFEDRVVLFEINELVHAVLHRDARGVLTCALCSATDGTARASHV